MGQLLTVASGGKLIQDVSHSGSHSLVAKSLDTGNLIKAKYAVHLNTNSIHHQMFYPYNLSESAYVPLGIVPPHARSKHHVLGTNKIVFEKDELEIVYYPLLKGIAVQGHPEMMPSTPFGQYINRCLSMILDGSMDEKCKVNIKKIYKENDFLDTSTVVRSFLLENKNVIIGHHTKQTA